MKRRRSRMGGVAAPVALWPALAMAEGTTVAGRFGDWKLYVHDSGGTKTCFVAVEPKEKKPAIANRATAVLYISAWPKDGVKSEISVKQGYTIKSGSKVAIGVGDATFKLFPKDERAFVSEPAQEAKLLAAMKTGKSLTVQGAPDRGQLTTDTYPLTGLTEALDAMSKSCP